jgi:hypothetical protein
VTDKKYEYKICEIFENHAKMSNPYRYVQSYGNQTAEVPNIPS